MKTLLISEATSTPLRLLTEEKNGRTVHYFEGTFGFVDRPTKNGRSYPKSLIARELERLSEDIEGGRFLGELDHPNDGKTLLSRVSHKVVSVHITDEGEIVGKAEILDRVPNGAILKGLYEHGVQVGVSSRGMGSTKSNGTEEVVQADFFLKAFDVVFDPANTGAYPRLVTEDVETQEPYSLESIAVDLPEVHAQILKAMEGEVVDRTRVQSETSRAAIAAKLEETFAERLAVEIGRMREVVRTELMEEQEADPSTASYRAIVEAVATLVSGHAPTDEQQATVEELRIVQADYAEAVDMLIESQLHLAVERNVPAHHRTSVRELCARTPGFSSLEEAEEFVKGIASMLPPDREKESTVARLERVENVARRMADEKKELISENDALREQLNKLKVRSARAGVRSSLPLSRAVDDLLEASNTPEEVDEAASTAVGRLLDRSLEGARSRAQNVRRGVESHSVEKTPPSVPYGFDEDEIALLGNGIVLNESR